MLIFGILSTKWVFPASRGLSRRGQNKRNEREHLSPLIFHSPRETSASRAEMYGFSFYKMQSFVQVYFLLGVFYVTM